MLTRLLSIILGIKVDLAKIRFNFEDEYGISWYFILLIRHTICDSFSMMCLTIKNSTNLRSN